MIEDLFVDRSDSGHARYTPMGEATSKKRQAVREAHCANRGLAPRMTPCCSILRTRRIRRSASAYGFCADIPSAPNTLRSSPSTDLDLEDLFISEGRLRKS